MLRDYTCTTKPSTPAFNITAVWGHWQDDIDDGQDQGNIWFSVDGKAAPCALWQPGYKGAQFDYIMQDNTTCLNNGNAKNYGVDGNDYWSEPFITVQSNWQTIKYRSNESCYPNCDVGTGREDLRMTITHDVLSPPNPDLDGTMFIIAGDPNFYLFESDGDNTSRVISANASSWYRFGASNRASYVNAKEIKLGMKSDIITTLKDADYECAFTLAPESGGGSSITASLDDLNDSDADYPLFSFKDFMSYEVPNWIPLNNKFNVSLNIHCKSSYFPNNPIDFHKKTMIFYKVKHF